MKVGTRWCAHIHNRGRLANMRFHQVLEGQKAQLLYNAFSSALQVSKEMARKRDICFCYYCDVTSVNKRKQKIVHLSIKVPISHIINDKAWPHLLWPSRAAKNLIALGEQLLHDISTFFMNLLDLRGVQKYDGRLACFLDNDEIDYTPKYRAHVGFPGVPKKEPFTTTTTRSTTK
jgi:hypothetical protein